MQAKLPIFFGKGMMPATNAVLHLHLCECFCLSIWVFCVETVVDRDKAYTIKLKIGLQVSCRPIFLGNTLQLEIIIHRKINEDTSTYHK